MAEGAPRFRRDLPASNVEADGVLYVEVSDPRSGKSFRFYDFEYAVALKLDGRPLDQVAADLRAQELELSPEQLAAFADQLGSLGFLDEAPVFFPPLAEDESGEWSSPAIRAQGQGGADRAQPPATAAPAADLGDDLTPGPPPAMAEVPSPFKPVVPSARSLSEHTFTSYPPSDRPDRQKDDGRADGRADGERQPWRPGGELPWDLGPGTPTPAPLGMGDQGNEQTVADMRAPSLDELEAPESESGARRVGAAVHDATESLDDLSSLMVDRTPSAGTAARTTAADEAATPPPSTEYPTPPATPATLPTPTVPPPAAMATLPTGSDKRELPTQRLRAVGEAAAELPSGLPSGIPGLGASARLGAPASLDDETATPPTGAPAVEGTARLPAESPAMRPKDVGRRPAWLAYAALGIFAAIIVSVMVYKYKVASEPPPLTVRALVPSPTTIYRWWDATGKVERAEGTAFAFASAGKVAEIAAPGDSFAAGDVIGLLEGGKRFRSELNHNKERLAFYQQMLETETQRNNKPEMRQAEIKIAEKKRLVGEAQSNLAKHSIVALQAGEVAETLVQVGAQVKEGDPALRVKGSTYRASFELRKEDADKARQLGFCRVEIENKPIDCSLSAEGGDETHVVIDLPNDPVVAAGKTVRLARDRLDAVFPLPASAVERVGETDRLYVVVGSRAELRVIAVADRTASEVVVSQGLDVGDRVILDRPTGLKQDARVLISETIAR